MPASAAAVPIVASPPVDSAASRSRVAPTRPDTPWVGSAGESWWPSASSCSASAGRFHCSGSSTAAAFVEVAGSVPPAAAGGSVAGFGSVERTRPVAR